MALVSLFICFSLCFGYNVPLLKEGWEESPVIVEDITITGMGDDPNESEAYYYWYAPDNSFGVSELKTVNWSYFWNLFLQHSAWQLEGWHPVNEEWVSEWQGENLNNWLNITKNRSYDNSSEKITLNVTNNAPVPIRFRFTFGIDARVLNYINKTANYSYVLTYPANATENYTVSFNWSDLMQFVENGTISLRHGIKEIEGNDVFWFRIIANQELGVGKWFEIDPTFGDISSDGSDVNIENQISGGYFQMGSTGGTGDKITAFCSETGTGTVTAKCALYDSSKNYVTDSVTNTNEIDGTNSWVDFTFVSSPTLVADAWYYIVLWGEERGGSTTSMMDYEANVGASGVFYDSETFNGFPGSFSADVEDDDGSASIYCTYTESAPENTAPTQSAQKIWNSTTSTEWNLNATGVSLTPTSFNVTVNDADGDKINITIMENKSGWKVVNQTSNGGLANGTYPLYNTSWIDALGTTYYITFNITDGEYWCNETYKFTTVASSWWDSSWNCHKRIILSNANNSYPMFFNVSKTSGGDVNCSGNCQNDFDDVRFIDIYNVTELSYWREKYVSGEYAWFWVNLSSDVETDNAINMYYSNPSAVYTGNGSNVFYYFDNWTTDNTGDWWSFRETVGGGDDTASNVLNITGGVGYNKRLRYRHTTEFWVIGLVSNRIGYCSNEWDVTYQYPDDWIGTLTSASDESTAVKQAWTVYHDVNGATGTSGYVFTDPYSTSAYYIREYTLISTNATTEHYDDYGNRLNITSETDGGDIPPASDLDDIVMFCYVDGDTSYFEHDAVNGELIFGGNRTTSSCVFSIDWMFMGKYNSPEPSVSSVGDEISLGWANAPPELTSEIPTNASTNIVLQPRLNVTVTDADGNQSTVYWYTNSTVGGTWYHIQTNTTILNESVALISFTNASNNHTKYWWRVSANDTNDNTSETYHFTTLNNNPVVTDEYPTNGTGNIPITPALHVQVNDNDGDLMNITWYSNSSGNYTLDSVYNLTDQAFPYGDEARYAVWINTTEEVYLFGGVTGTYEFDVFKWKIGSNPTQLPDATHSVKAPAPVWNWKAGKIYVYCNDTIYWLDPSDDSNGTTTEGYGGYYHNSFATYSPVQNKSYIFGGRNYSSNTVVNYTWVHDASASTFTRMMNNNLTLPVTSMSGAYVPEQDAIYLLGSRGAPAQTIYNDIYRFNCSTETLTRLEDIYSNVKCPTDVEGMAVFYHPDDQLIYCFGGLSDLPSYPTYLDDIWTFNPFNYTTSYPIVNLSTTIFRRQDDFSGIYNTSSGYGYLLPCLDVHAGDNEVARQKYITQVNFTSSWEQFGINTSVSNGTYYQTNANFSEYDTNYYWRVCVNDGHGGYNNETYNFTTPSKISISLNVSSFDFGTRDTNIIVYSNDTNPNYFGITNDGNADIDLQIKAVNMTNATYSYEWNLSDTPDADQYALACSEDGVDWHNISKDLTTFYTNLLSSTSISIDLRLKMPVSITAGHGMQNTVTITAILH